MKWKDWRGVPLAPLLTQQEEGRVRTLLYWLARLMGDAGAVRRGTYPRRHVRKMAHRKAGRTINRWI